MFSSENNYRILKASQLKIDLNSPRFASKIPSSQEEARSIIANSPHIESLMSSIEENGIFESLIVFDQSTPEIDNYIIVEGIRRYVCLLELMDKYSQDNKPFPEHFTRIPCFVESESKARELSENLHFQGHKEYLPFTKAKMLAHYKGKDADRFNRLIEQSGIGLQRANILIYSYELMQKYKDYFNRPDSKRKMDSNLFSYFHEYVKIKGSIRWLNEKQFVRDLSTKKITKAQHIRMLNRSKRDKKLIEFYKKIKTTDELEEYIYQHREDDHIESTKKNLENSLNLDYFARKKLQFQSNWQESSVLSREFNYKDPKELEKQLDEIDKEYEKEKPEIIFKLKAFGEFEYFRKTIEAEDKCFESIEFDKEIIKGFKKNSLNESQKNDFINLLANEFFDFFYMYEKQSTMYNFCLKKETNQSISFYLRTGKLSNLDELQVIKELANNRIVLDDFKKNDAASVLKKIEIFKSADSNNEQSNNVQTEKVDMIYRMINAHESKSIELKSSFNKNLQTNQSRDPIVRFQVLKTVNAFINTMGGSLIIGVTDQGQIIGIDDDDYENDDKYKRLIDDTLKSSLKSENSLLWDVEIINLPKEKKKICLIKCDATPGLIPIFYKKYNEAWNRSKQSENKKIELGKKFYFKRDSAGSTEMDTETALNYSKTKSALE